MKKKIAYGVIPVLLSLSSLVFAVSVTAEEGSMHNMGKGMTKMVENALNRLEKFESQDFQGLNAPSTVAINPGGHTRITNGKVMAINGDIITVEIWKLSFSVHKMSDTKVFAVKGKEFTWEEIKVGDMVNVLGQLDMDKASFIHAKVIHDRTQLGQEGAKEASRLQGLINELIRRLNELLIRQGKPPLPTPTPSVTPTPSPTATPSPTPSPTPSSSLTPSPTPSPSPSPTSSPTPSPTPSPTATPSPTPSPTPTTS